MKIAEEYFERLLRSDRPTEAVTQLDQVWCSRPEVSAQAARFGLAEAEYNDHLVLLYTGAVSNGGHGQFFDGPLRQFARDTITALEATGLPSLAETLQLAVNRRIPYATADRRADAELLSVDGALLDYARRHASEICLPERAD